MAISGDAVIGTNTGKNPLTYLTDSPNHFSVAGADRAVYGIFPAGIWFSVFFAQILENATGRQVSKSTGVRNICQQPHITGSGVGLFLFFFRTETFRQEIAHLSDALYPDHSDRSESC